MDDLRKAYRIVSIIGLAMIAGIFVYAAVVGLVAGGQAQAGEPAEPDAAVQMVKFVLLGVSAALFFVIRRVNTHFLSSSGSRPGRAAEPASQAGPSPVAQRFVTAAVVSFALCEVPATFGLVHFFLSRSQTDFSLFMMISLLFFAVHFPKFSQWEEASRQQRR